VVSTLNTTINSIGTPEVTQLVANISIIYVPELVVGYTPVRLPVYHCAGVELTRLSGVLQ
jgi:hypothetical protein